MNSLEKLITFAVSVAVVASIITLATPKQQTPIQPMDNYTKKIEKATGQPFQ